MKNIEEISNEILIRRLEIYKIKLSESDLERCFAEFLINVRTYLNLHDSIPEIEQDFNNEILKIFEIIKENGLSPVQTLNVLKLREEKENFSTFLSKGKIKYLHLGIQIGNSQTYSIKTTPVKISIVKFLLERISDSYFTSPIITSKGKELNRKRIYSFNKTTTDFLFQFFNEKEILTRYKEDRYEVLRLILKDLIKEFIPIVYDIYFWNGSGVPFGKNKSIDKIVERFISAYKKDIGD